ncbi:hypothetical protein GH5_07743 [Leishmania sp. Ghana 2012 LV757]|uniref:hypothetical protein n=1 Tax=Leishmania sp. Ghana 2012 LV757 TaxID=2803181 RepID=UPI001B57CD1C|nr:hypothetical protein GH5_07743 [Leishmania sp. Ghana 2012 LV757]
MNALRLGSYSGVCWRPGKAGFMDVVGAISHTEVPQQTLSGGGAVACGPIALECVKQPEQDLAVWMGWKGCRKFNKSGKGLRKVIYVCTTVTHSGVFFTYHSGKRLGFALIAHDARDPKKLRKPILYTEELRGLMADVLHNEAEKRVTVQAMERQLVTIRQAVLRQTLEGHILAAVVVNRRGEVYAVVAHLGKNAWRKWRMEVAMGYIPCIHVPEGGREVHFVHFDVDAPIDHTASVVAPSLPLALSTFDRVSASGAILTAPLAAVTPPLLCVLFHEFILPTRGAGVAAERIFQSQCIESVSDGVRAMPRPCLALVDEATAVYTVIVPCEESSCLLHMRHSLSGSGLMTSCAMMAGLHRPISACTLCIPSPHQPRGVRLSLVLSDDMKLYCCEQFGQVVAVSLSIEGVSCPVLTLPVPPVGKSSKRMGTAVVHSARLIPLHNQTEVLCTNGMVGLFFRVTSASFRERVPGPHDLTVDSTGEATGNGAAGGAAVGAAALRLCLESLQQLSLRTSRHDLPDVVFRLIMPHLRYVGTSQQEVMLMQRVYEQLLHMAEPNLESEWSYLWTLTSLLQKVLVKHGRDNQLRYTDKFFLQLANVYRQSSFASPSGMSLVGNGVRAMVSAEAQDVMTAPTASVPAETRYVLDGLAAGIAPVALAEEVVRRIMRTEDFSNGVCVVTSQAGVADCVHCMGCVLVASCLDVSAFVISDEVRGLCVSLERSQKDVCVAVQPHAFASQEEFETALTLAGDLLCVYSADASFRPDLALLTLGIGGRQHCLSAFLQLFAPVLRDAVSAVAPLANNRTWFEECVSTLAQSSTELASTLLRKGSSDSFTLTATLCHLLCAAQRGVDGAFFRCLSGTLSEEFCTTALVADLFHQTEGLLAATQNYASALAVCVLERKNDAEQSAHWQAIDVGRKRLRAVLAQTCAMWAHIDSLSPYRVRDVAESYRMSAGASLTPAASAAPASAEGTMVSRTLVLCFRMLCLIQYSMRAEEDMGLLRSDDADRWTSDGAVVRECQGALETLYVMADGPLPLEWFQWKFISQVRHAAAIKPTWVPYLVRLMQLSNVQQSSSATLKCDFYSLLDTLQSLGAPYATAVAEGDMQRAVAAAEHAVDALSVGAAHHDTITATEGVSPALPAPTAFFIFSHQRDASLPRWTHSHSLPERRYLFSSTWVDALWTLERVPGVLHSACAAALARVQLAASEEEITRRGGDHPPALSENLARPLYAHLYQLLSPVRMHSVTDGATAEGDGACVSEECRAERAQQTEVAAREATRTPEKLAAPPQQEHAQAAVAPSVSTAAFEPLLSLDIERGAAVRAGASEPTPKREASSKVNLKAAAPAEVAAPAELAAPAEAALAAPAGTGLYSPANVAWWDTLELTPSPQRSVGVKAGSVTETATSPDTADYNGESSDTATTYTTSTSSYVDPVATLESFHRRRYTRGDSHKAAESFSSTWSDSESHLCKCHCAAAYSQAQHEARKRCRCCSRVMRANHRGRSVGQRGEVADDSAPVRVQWSGKARETRAAYARPPPVTVSSRTAAAARPSMLTSSTRLQPPEEPPSRLEKSARASPSHSAAPISLLTFSSASKGKETSRVRLYTLDGDHVRCADGQDMVPLLSASRPDLGATAGTLLDVPPLPASSVFVAPPPLPGLSSQTAGAKFEHGRVPAPGAAEAEQPVRFVEMGLSYPQVPRAPTSVAPPAVDLATLQAPATSPSMPVRVADEVPAAAYTAAPLATSPVSVAPATVTPLPVPTATPTANPSVLTPAQMSDFRRYTDGLLTRQRESTPSHVATAASVSAAAPTVLGLPPAAPALTSSGVTAEMARLLHQQEDFIRKAEAVLEESQAENRDLYRRVEESIRSLSAASQHFQGLSPSEQAQLVQSTIKQRNELLTLNSKLLEMQTAAARASGEAPPAPTTTSQHFQGLSPSEQAQLVQSTIKQRNELLTLNSKLLEMQTAAARASGEAPPAPTTTSQHFQGLSPSEQAQLVQSTIKQRNELLTLNSKLLEMQTAAARASGEAPPIPAVSSAGSQVTPSRLTSTDATQTQLQPRKSVGVSWMATGGSTVSTAAAAAPPHAILSPGHKGMQETLSDLQRLNAELLAVGVSTEAIGKAIKETQEVIERYERYKTAEALVAEGTALTSAMRQRTAAIERQLAGLQHKIEPTVAPDAKGSSSVGVSQSFVAGGVGYPLAAAPPAPSLVGLTSSTAVVPSSLSCLAAQAGTPAVTAGEALLSRNEAQHIPSCYPVRAVLPSTSVPLTLNQPQSPELPPSTPAMSTAPGVLTATLPASATFTCVSSLPLDEATVPWSAPPPASAPPGSLSFHTGGISGGETPSLDLCESTERTTLDQEGAVPHSMSAPRVTAQLRDLGSLFVEAGGRYDAPRGANAAAPHRRAAPHDSLLVCSPKRMPYTAERRSLLSTHTLPRSHHMHEDRYAMYRVTSSPAKVRPVAAVTPIRHTPCVLSSPPTKRMSTGDPFVDRQQCRRAASIAKRMQQLERDLFS